MTQNILTTNELSTITIKGAREHNLKNIDLELPKKKLIVFTGVSGSGKSSLAFDTIFAEGQRRYVESLSAYARQFIGQMVKPQYDTIRGLSPTISIEQKSASKNPRSTVGTITEIYDYLRVLFARIGEQFCVKCGKVVGKGDAESMVSQIVSLPISSKILILAPLVENRKGEHRDILDKLRKDGFARVRIDGVVHNLEDIQSLAKNKKHNIDVVVDRLIVSDSESFKKRVTDSVETALKAGNGELIVHVMASSNTAKDLEAKSSDNREEIGHKQEDIRMSEARSCCGIAYPELEPALFSFNSPLGMCPECNGIGTLLYMDPYKIVPDHDLTIRQGAVLPWKNYFFPKNFFNKNSSQENGSEDDLAYDNSFEKEGDSQKAQYNSKGDSNQNPWGMAQLLAMESQWGISFDTPWKEMSEKDKDIILNGGNGRKLLVNWQSAKIKGEVEHEHEGLIHTLMRRYRTTQSEGQKRYYSSFMSEQICSVCGGKRLKPEVLHVKIDGKSIIDITEMSIRKSCDFISSLKLEGNRKLIAGELIKEIAGRLGFLINVGLDYLSLDRKGPTLSGGESQRIRLASQVGSELTGVLYILDEPSIGLHQRDNEKLIKTLCHLRDIGNTLIVVEHDEETMNRADWIVDIGPGAGELGGEITAQGTPEEIKKNPNSLTGKFLNGSEKIEIPKSRKSPTDIVVNISSSNSPLTQMPIEDPNHERSGSVQVGQKGWITIKNASENNLQNIDVNIPLGLMVAVTGVSGAGKSTLINQILYPAIARELNGSTLEVGKHDGIDGFYYKSEDNVVVKDNAGFRNNSVVKDKIDVRNNAGEVKNKSVKVSYSINKIINIDQKPIGRTPRSNPATYTKVFDPIRDLFAMIPESRSRGYQKGRYSFNVKGGRCEACSGDGYIKVEMHFLADVFVPCEVCRGKRFNSSTLEIKYKDHSIADILDLSVIQACHLFANHPQIINILNTLMDVGLSYIKLGQAATTLSGGEAQRIKLARELARRDTGQTLYILDEPTTGLHFQDIRLLLNVLKRLRDGGNTVIVIEHNLDVIKTADWVIDLGPEGGSRGGQIVAQGTPEEVALSKGSYTGYYLNKILSK
ncbi:MAG: excinuclease ABC subunit UvrA [Desulfamplus sp.]|nr:excinuclease ABC subunit UvrA [Desulfamplus sp.]